MFSFQVPVVEMSSLESAFSHRSIPKLCRIWNKPSSETTFVHISRSFEQATIK